MKIFYSRTFWTIVVIFLIGGVEAISGMLGGFATPVLAVLSAMAIYFRINPKVDF